MRRAWRFLFAHARVAGRCARGSVNVVPRSSFNRSRRPSIQHLSFDARQRARLRQDPGPRKNPTRKVHPGFDFFYVRPVNQRFGSPSPAAVRATTASRNPPRRSGGGTGAATNGNAYPHTTPDKPYLTSYTIGDGSKDVPRDAFGVTLDYRSRRWTGCRSRISGPSSPPTNEPDVAFNITRVAAGAFTPRSTHAPPVPARSRSPTTPASTGSTARTCPR